jgi:subtilisin
MAKRGRTSRSPSTTHVSQSSISSNPDSLLKAALDSGLDATTTGRHLICYREGMEKEAMAQMRSNKLRVAHSRDFEGQNLTLEAAGDAEVLYFDELGVSVLSGDATLSRGGDFLASIASAENVQLVEPEYFVFSLSSEYLRGFLSAATAIAKDLGSASAGDQADQEEASAVGATWGLVACRVPPSTRSGVGIRVAVLDTGLDLGHPDFAGRSVTSQTFVGEPVQDLHGHGTHCVGTACGPLRPHGATPVVRYGVAHRSSIFVGKVLSNAGNGVGGSVLAGMNWAVANNCQVISMSLGSISPPQVAYTNAGNAALNRGCLIIAAAGNDTARPTRAPANSPSIMSVASLDRNLAPSSFSNVGKIDISGPGRDVASSWPRPQLYRTISGTSMATPHVAGCAALWAESDRSLRGTALWNRLKATSRRLPYTADKVGAGLVQAP